jgi:hypothetical protein
LGTKTLDVLEVKAEQEHHREGGAVVHQGCQIGEGEDGISSQEGHVQHRIFRPQLPMKEGNEADDPQANQRDARPCRKQGEPVHDGGEREAVETRPHAIELLPLRLHPISLQA